MQSLSNYHSHFDTPGGPCFIFLFYIRINQFHLEASNYASEWHFYWQIGEKVFTLIPKIMIASSVQTVLPTKESNNRATVMIGFGLELSHC